MQLETNKKDSGKAFEFLFVCSAYYHRVLVMFFPVFGEGRASEPAKQK